MTERAQAQAPEPLGVTALGGDVVHVAIHAPDAERVTLCLFDADDQETARHDLPERTGGVWHGRVPGVPPGTRYGLRAAGPWRPDEGLRFNPAKLLIDPHAHVLDRIPRLHASMFGQRADDPSRPDETDSAPYVPKAIVADASTLAVLAPAVLGAEIPWPRTVIYELHVRGFTMRHPGVPAALRGTFAGLGHPAAIAHLRRLGVTTVEVMPCAAWIEERHLARLGLTNYWGYNPIALCAPDPRLAPGGWAEIRATVAALAEAGIETIIDVVLNHTGEGDELGPTLSLRGLDNAGYYRLRQDDRARYVDDTGCGHALACDRPAVVRLCMDALRAWAGRAGVHGFRFDLGTILGRRADGFDAAAPLLTAIGQDPMLRSLKLIAEPWDIGMGGYRLGQFPPYWAEWNDRFRDDVRRFWRGEGVMLGPLATRMAGSADVLGGVGRRPSRSINFVVAHDGFTLADLVSFEQRRNLANGEDGRDGASDNHSWNCGVEGPTQDASVRAARRRDQAALLATLLLARGTPMLAMGSELGQSQGGNNNAYAQDNAISWLDWDGADQALIDLVGALVRARLAQAALTEDRFLTGTGRAGTGRAPAGTVAGGTVAGGVPDVEWRRPDGAAMAPADWAAGDTLCFVLADAAGGRVLVALHRGAAAATLRLPDGAWRLEAGDGTVATGVLALPARSVALLAQA